MMEFAATEAAFPALPAHLVIGSAYAHLPAHPLGVRPLPAGAHRPGHLHSHHHDEAGAEDDDDEESPQVDAPDEDEVDEDEDGDEVDEEEEEVEVDNECRKSGLGVFAELDDSTVYHVLQQLPREDLLTLSLVSRAFYAFAEDDQLWKNFILHRGAGNCTCAHSGLSPPSLHHACSISLTRSLSLHDAGGDAELENFSFKGALWSSSSSV
jgi:hypothetical protein